MKTRTWPCATLFVMIMLLFSCTTETMISSENNRNDRYPFISEITKADSFTDCYYHESTGLVVRWCSDSKYAAYHVDSLSKENISRYALKIQPKTYLQQKQIEQMTGITVSYIPFGYEPMCIPRSAKAFRLTLPHLQDDTREISSSSAIRMAGGEYTEGGIMAPSQIKLPALYVEWPVDRVVPNDIDYEIQYVVPKEVDQQRIVYPTRYWLVFQSYDSVLFTNIRLKNLKIRVSKSGSVISEQLTDSQGRIKITSDQATYESEPLTYSITAICSSPKWTIPREITLSTPIHTSVGTLSQHFNSSSPLDTIYITLASSTTEFEIHRAIDYYRNDSHELSSTILSDENSLVIAASDSTVINDIHGNTYWSDAENVDRITIYDSDENTQTLMGVILHEIGHARKDYAQGASYYCNKQQRLIHESYASFIGYYLSRQYYISKGYSLTGTNYISFNGQNRQNWTYELSHASPLFVDLSDNLNQHTYLSIYVDDTISGVPISSIDQLGKNSIDLTGFINNISPLVGVYFTQSELNTMLSYYSDY